MVRQIKNNKMMTGLKYLFQDDRKFRKIETVYLLMGRFKKDMPFLDVRVSI